MKPIDRSLAFTALLEQDWYRSMTSQEAEQVTTKFLEDYERSGAKDMWSFSRTWLPAPEKSGPAQDNPYRQPYSPEHKSWKLAHEAPGLSDEDFAREVGWVPNDGTYARDDLLAIYKQEQFNVRAPGLYTHAADWAYNQERTDYDTAQDYAAHVVEMDRAGDLTPTTSHTTTYPMFAAERQAEEPEEYDPESDPAVADYLESLEQDALDGPHFYDPDPEPGL